MNHPEVIVVARDSFKKIKLRYRCILGQAAKRRNDQNRGHR